MRVWFIQLPILFGFSFGIRIQGPRADTENGPIIGTYEKSYSGFEFLSFRGIPYAKPPTGENRFKEPQRLKDKWIGEWDATNFGSACLQLNHFTKVDSKAENVKYAIEGSEDCLFLNVYAREDGPANKSVVFMIHGGAFMFGYSDMYGPAYIMDRDDIVLVTFNYRVGPLGFITTGDAIIPGNNGLKDQVAALEWVHRNIANFKGDSNKITISGLSAGGASVDYMFLSPLTKGLFQRGYSFSGTSLCPWALVTNGAERTKQLAEGLGCPTKDSKTILKCLRRRPAQQIVRQVEKLLVFLYNPFTVFGPVVENTSANYFINQHPREILEQGLAHDLPWIVGVTSEDGLYPGADLINDKVLSTINEKWNEIGSSLLFIDPKYSPQETQSVLSAVRKHYFDEKDINASTRSSLIKLLTERDFVAGTIETAKLRKVSYLYYYTYQSATSFSNVLTGSKEKLGASHVDDFLHIIDFGPLVQSHTTDEDRAVASVIKDIFFNFVSNGNLPKDYNWKPYVLTNEYLVLNSPTGNAISKKPIINFEEYADLFSPGSQTKDEL